MRHCGGHVEPARPWQESYPFACQLPMLAQCCRPQHSPLLSPFFSISLAYILPSCLCMRCFLCFKSISPASLPPPSNSYAKNSDPLSCLCAHNHHISWCQSLLSPPLEFLFIFVFSHGIFSKFPLPSGQFLEPPALLLTTRSSFTGSSFDFQAPPPVFKTLCSFGGQGCHISLACF